MTPIDAIGWLIAALLAVWLAGTILTVAGIMYLVWTMEDEDE